VPSLRVSPLSQLIREGAPPIDLIDGDALVELLRKYELGMTSTARTVYDMTVGKSFFESV
jgi:restriction system protein